MTALVLTATVIVRAVLVMMALFMGEVLQMG
jgi:hypothetical protein